MPTNREIYTAGSLPPSVTADGIPAAMRWVLQQAGGPKSLVALACDEDPRWIINYLDALAARPELKAIREGKSEDYEDMPIYRPVGKITPRSITMHRLPHIEALMKAHEELGDERGALPLQISMPNPLDLSLFVFCGKPSLRHPLRTIRGAYLALRHLKKFEIAAATEVDAIEAARHRLGFTGALHTNLESPAVLFALNLLPRPLRPLAAWWLAKQVARVLNRLPAGHVYLHLCVGGLRKKAIIVPKTMRPAVQFLNRLAPRTTVLPPVHLPAAFGDQPPPVDHEFYEPLELLDEDYRIAAGVVSEHSPYLSRRALELLETYADRTSWAVGPPCGLGRHTEKEAEAVYEISTSLLHD
jgi:hypothetical protein